jgi:hypothetical protein
MSVSSSANGSQNLPQRSLPPNGISRGLSGPEATRIEMMICHITFSGVTDDDTASSVSAGAPPGSEAGCFRAAPPAGKGPRSVPAAESRNPEAEGPRLSRVGVPASS